MSHPLAELDAGYRFHVPLLSGDHVTDDTGTGFVHTAPGHGADDYKVWLAHGLSRDAIPDTVDPDGAYYPDVPLFGGLKVLETEGKKAGKFGPANGAVIDKLIEAGNLLARGRLEHSYPHSWRSKAPVIFRNTPQWFVRVADDGLRATALKAIDDTAFYPAQGRNRIRSMVESRPDWLISRQRAWGRRSPCTWTGKPASRCGTPTSTPASSRLSARRARTPGSPGRTRISSAMATTRPTTRRSRTSSMSGSTAARPTPSCWRAAPIAAGRRTSIWRVRTSIAAGSSPPCWSSCGTRGRAPYNGVLTHGFVLDEQGEKMSKSKGNVVDPQVIARESGVEILRLWVAMSDYAEDLRIGKTILQTTVDAYRKLRNTVRYLLGALHGFEETERLPVDQMPPLERFILHRLWRLDGQVRAAYEAYSFQDVWRPILDFCSRTCRRCISTCARTASIATGPMPCVGVRRAR